MQLVIVALGVVLVLAGLYFAIGGFGQSRGGGGYKSIRLEGPAWLFVVLIGAGLVIFGAVWDWSDGESDDVGPPVSVTIGEPSTGLRPCVPEGLSPRAGDLLDNGRTDRGDAITWRFTWIDCPDADSYQLVVAGETSSLALIDETLAGTNYDYLSEGSYIVDANRLGWTWRVRARTDGVWSDWFEGSFDVEPVDSD